MAAFLLLLLLGTPTTSHASDIAPEPVPSDVIEWFEEFAASGELRYDFDQGEYLDALGIDAIEDIETGDPVPVHQWYSRFLRGETDGLDGIETLDMWIAPVYINGEAAGTISAVRDSPDAKPDFFEVSAPETDAGILAEVAPDEFLVDERPIGAWLAVSTDGRVRGLNGAGLREVPEPISLSEYAQRSVERYAESFKLPKNTDMAGGASPSGDFDPGESTSDWALVAAIGGGVLLVAAGAAAYRRRGRFTRRGR